MTVVYLGKFLWGGRNYSETARNTRIEDRRPDATQAYVITELQLADGTWPGPDNAGLDITNAMENEDGYFKWYVNSLGFVSIFLETNTPLW